MARSLVSIPARTYVTLEKGLAMRQYGFVSLNCRFRIALETGG